MSVQGAPLRVLVAEDHFVTRMGIKAILESEPGVMLVAEAESGRAAIDGYRACTPDVMLVDLRLPDLSGVEVITAVRSEFADAKILVLTGSDSSEDIYRAIQAGARAYLRKDSTGTDLVKAVRDVHAGRRVIPADIAAKLAERVPQSELSPREIEVLGLASEGNSNKRIADRLGLSEATVRTHMSNILAKLGADDRTQAAAEALRRGIIL